MKKKYRDILLNALQTNTFICPKCGNEMVLENELDDIVVCLKCGYDTDFEGYACEDNYDDLYDDDENLEPTEEDLMSEDERLEAYYSQFEIEDF